MTSPYEPDGRTMRERMLAGDQYLADDPELAELSLVARDLADAYNATTSRQAPLRRELLERLLGSVGDGTEIRPPFLVDYGTNITLGARCFANYGLVALDVAPITIGDDVQIGPNVQLLTPTHPVEPEPRRDKWEAAKPITIGDNVWLGGGVVVCPGVTIGADTVVGAGSVVTRDLPARVVAVGNPARVVREV
ncbi:sugar O-acetyltransferase [Nocardioides dongxiaopingii]|uniref:sugar O-acetyltransferase n=1 Tax=Nocardioides dongxiaopingii TaxID=2576036 RepID=UPI002482601E|nr:sugar O-acetyltransferase [Nocardioides dongxiaopingii]